MSLRSMSGAVEMGLACHPCDPGSIPVLIRRNQNGLLCFAINFGLRFESYSLLNYQILVSCPHTLVKEVLPQVYYCSVFKRTIVNKTHDQQYCNGVNFLKMLFL